MPVHVSRLDQPPHRCAFTLRDQDPEGFFTGQVLSGWDPSAAISVSYARSLARELGYVHPDEQAETQKMLGQYAGRCDQLEAEVADLRAKFDAIDVIESEGFRARRKAGRPPTQIKEKV